MPTRRCARATRSRAAPISMPPIASATGRSPAAIGCAATSCCGRSTSRAPSTTLTPAPLQALGLSVGHDVARRPAAVAHAPHRGARSRTRCRTQESRKKPETWFAGCRTHDLPIYLLGTEADAIALYEQIISRLRRRLFPLSRRFRRSGHRAGAAGLPAPDRLRRGGCAVSERQADLPRLRFPARVFHVPAQVPRLPPDRPGERDAAAARRSRST